MRCNECNKGFKFPSTATILKRHWSKQHSEKEQPADRIGSHTSPPHTKKSKIEQALVNVVSIPALAINMLLHPLVRNLFQVLNPHVEFRYDEGNASRPVQFRSKVHQGRNCKATNGLYKVVTDNGSNIVAAFKDVLKIHVDTMFLDEPSEEEEDEENEEDELYSIETEILLHVSLAYSVLCPFVADGDFAFLQRIGRANIGILYTPGSRWQIQTLGIRNLGSTHFNGKNPCQSIFNQMGVVYPENQELKFEIWDFDDNKKKNFLGQAISTLGSIVNTKGGKEMDLYEILKSKEKDATEIQKKKLKSQFNYGKDSGNTSDPYLAFYEVNDVPHGRYSETRYGPYMNRERYGIQMVVQLALLASLKLNFVQFTISCTL
uniref:C2H2-type domain-containing protein n=1 Tax=Ditylenchus dipsaci TaxID=166011 RepID=A0A915EMD8_9BILA